MGLLAAPGIVLAALCIGGVMAAHAQPFAAFGEDEDACRLVGTGAIGDAAGSPASGGNPVAAASRYDFAYRRCMAAHFRARQMRMYSQGGPERVPGDSGNPHSFDYPDAFYSIPYATPGYGYDGFSY